MAGPHTLIIGCGSIRERHLRCFLQARRSRVAACEANAELAVPLETEWAPALRSGRYSSVVICTPAPLHVRMARAAVDAGVDVLAEKPLSHSLDGVADLLAARDRTRRTIAVAYVLHQNPALHGAREFVARGDFGPVRQATVVTGQPFHRLRPAYAQTYYRDRATGGGAIQDALTHSANWIESVLGPTESVLCDCAHLGLPNVTVDAVWLCTEHVPNDWIGLENQIRAARLHDVDTLVRVGRGSYSDYIRPLEADATGIIVPHVANADEARQIVEWVRFHPIGKRALDGGNIDGRFCLLPLEDYLRHSNHERVVVLQIESPEALEHVEAIAAVPGFDALLFGPGDFSHRIGKPGQLNAPQVVAARKRVAQAARAAGKYAMTAGLIAPFAELVAEGYQIFNVGANVVGLAGCIRERVKVIDAELSALPPAARPPKTPYA